jgi:hypothetical protein
MKIKYAFTGLAAVAMLVVGGAVAPTAMAVSPAASGTPTSHNHAGHAAPAGWFPGNITATPAGWFPASTTTTPAGWFPASTTTTPAGWFPASIAASVAA